MNHNRNFDKNTIKTKYISVLFLIFICLSIFSYQSNFVVNSNDNVIWDISNPYVSQNFTEIAFIASSSKNINNPYLIVKNLTMGVTNSYHLCRNCFIYLDVQSILFYNQTSFLFLISTGNGQSEYLYNMATKTLTTFGSGYTPFYINSTLYLGVFSSEINNNNSQLFLQNPINSHIITVEFNNLKVNETFNRITFNSELTKVVIANGDKMYFYTIKDNIAQLFYTSKIHFLNTPSYNLIQFHFLPWGDPSVVYYSDYNSTYTQLNSFNFSSQKENVITKMNKGLFINSINTKLQVFTTQYPNQLYSLEKSITHLLLASNYQVVVWNNLYTKALATNSDKIILFTFDYQTQKINNEQVLFLSITTNDKLVLNIVESFNLISTGVLFVAIIIISKIENVWDLDYL